MAGPSLLGIVGGERTVRPPLLLHDLMGADRAVMTLPDPLQGREHATRLSRGQELMRQGRTWHSQNQQAVHRGRSGREQSLARLTEPVESRPDSNPRIGGRSAGTSPIQRPSTSRSSSTVSFIARGYHRLRNRERASKTRAHNADVERRFSQQTQSPGPRQTPEIHPPKITVTKFSGIFSQSFQQVPYLKTRNADVVILAWN